MQAARDVPDEGPAPLEELDRRRSRRKVGVVLLWNRGLARLALDRLVVVLAGALAQLPAAVVAPNVKGARRLASSSDDDRRVRAAGRDADDPAVGQALDALRRSLAAAVAVPSRPRAPAPQVNTVPSASATTAWRGPQATSRARRRPPSVFWTTARGAWPRAPCGRSGRRPSRRGARRPRPRSWRSPPRRRRQEVARGVQLRRRRPRRGRGPRATSRTPARRPPEPPPDRRRRGRRRREEPRGRLARRRRRRLRGAARLARPRRGRRQRLLSPVEPSQFAVEVERPVVGLRGRRRPRPPAAGPRGEAAAMSSSCDRRRRSGAGRSLLPPRGMRRDGAVADATDGVRRDRVAEPLPRSRSGRSWSFFIDFLLVRTSAISALSC